MLRALRLSRSCSSWRDPAKAKHATLSRWAQERETRTGEQTSLWLDKACIDQTDITQSLLCLPVFLAFCNELLVLAGPSYSSRLWCVLELYTFVIVRPAAGGLVIRPFDEAGPFKEGCETEYFRTFDANKASCYLAADRHHLLAVIEAGYGSIRAFNRRVRRIVDSLDNKKTHIAVISP